MNRTLPRGTCSYRTQAIRGGDFKLSLPGFAKRIELWPIEKLVPRLLYPRLHSRAQTRQIAASIEAFGFNVPILVDSAAGIIAGHGRLLAERELGLIEVPVIVLDHLTHDLLFYCRRISLSETGGFKV